jgi:hypothetical protein
VAEYRCGIIAFVMLVISEDRGFLGVGNPVLRMVGTALGENIRVDKVDIVNIVKLIG